MSKERRSPKPTTEILPKARLIREFAHLIDAAAQSLNLVPTSDFQRYALMFRDDRVWGSMQLTKFGFGVLSDYPRWSSPLEKKLTFGDHTFLIEISSFPYYLSSKVFITFDPDLGMTMQFLKGDFEKLRSMR